MLRPGVDSVCLRMSCTKEGSYARGFLGIKMTIRKAHVSVLRKVSYQSLHFIPDFPA